MAALTLAAFLCLSSGFLLVCLTCPRQAPLIADLLLKVSLSVGFGLGIFSVIYFLSLLLGVSQLLLVDSAVFVLLLVGLLSFRAHGPSLVNATTDNGEPPLRAHRLLAIAFALALCAALYAAIMRTIAYPHGDGWDAFSIWNLHARFLFLGGPHWRDGFSSLIPWSHPDYPLLLPAAIAHFWSYLGRDTPAVPGIIGFLFTFSTIGVLFSTLSILRGRTAAMLGATVLLATPAFIELGTSQYADVPLSFFILATVALLCLHDSRTQDDHSHFSSGLLALVGLAAGCAAWTKNEGLLFLSTILLARLLTLIRYRRSSVAAIARELAPLLVTAVPVLLLVAYFKHFIAPPGDLFSDSTTALHKLMDPARYSAILRWYGKSFLRFGHWFLIPGTLLLAAFYFATGRGVREKELTQTELGLRASIWALGLTLAGYFVIYLITPYDIYWHLRFSLPRLFLQLWPSAIFVFFLSIIKDKSGAPNCGEGAPSRAL
jgi:hypothetical protein